MKTLNIGIMTQDEIRQRVMAIANGTLKPNPNDPTVWFTSMDSVAKILSDEHRSLLTTIFEEKPDSISELSKHTGQSQGKLSRTLRSLANFGIVELKAEGGAIRPVVHYTRFQIFTQ